MKKQLEVELIKIVKSLKNTKKFNFWASKFGKRENNAKALNFADIAWLKLFYDIMIETKKEKKDFFEKNNVKRA